MEKTTPQALTDIAAERQRQQEAEGWTPEHDDSHTGGEMAQAAAFYAATTTTAGVSELRWPWAWSWFKPTSKRRALVKAAALIVAEIERLDRIAT